MPNPSHLEAVDPVVVGFARAKADVLYESDYDKIFPILIHGDASVAGQGIVYEVLQMCDLKGYYTGGTIHFVINNQIGFTTDFDDARSSDYCTSLLRLWSGACIACKWRRSRSSSKMCGNCNPVPAGIQCRYIY